MPFVPISLSRCATRARKSKAGRHHKGGPDLCALTVRVCWANMIYRVREDYAGKAAEKILWRRRSLCRDYLALSGDEANGIGAFSFEDAAKTLLAISPNYETPLNLLHHRLQTVRGRAILDCVALLHERWDRRPLQ